VRSEKFLVLLFCLTCNVSANESADQLSTPGAKMLPRWEYGLAVAGLRAPAYGGSASSREEQFILPWAVYRGDKIRMQDGGASLIALENESVTIDLSIGGSLDASSEDAPLRENMPELDFLLELGPKIDLRLLDERVASNQKRKVTWSNALRAVISTDLKSVDSRGFVLGSTIEYEHEWLGNLETEFAVRLNATWSAESLMDYLYEVTPEFARADRAQYDAQSGFVGTKLSVGIGRDFTEKISGYLGISHTLYDGAANRDSPLLETDAGTSVFGGLSYEIGRSSESVVVVGE